MPIRSNKPQGATGRRGDIVRMLRKATHPLSTAEIADRLDVHPNTVRFHVDTLIANGQVERLSAQHRAPGRPPQLFRAVAGMDPAGPRHYRLLAEILVDTLAAAPNRDDRAVEVGRTWGREHCLSRGTSENDPSDPVDRLVALLDEVGFAPERGNDHEQSAISTPQINLRNCPFLELALKAPQVACPIHLGLMQGAMEAWQAPVTTDRLEAFVEPDRCVAHLATIKRA